MRYLAKVIQRVEKDVVTRVRRSLRGRGKLNVQVGQQVAPDEILGNSTVFAGFRTLNLSTVLSVAPSEVEKFLTRKIGQKIYKDELLAVKQGGLLGRKKVVVSSIDGVLDFLNSKTGELRISFVPKEIKLPAGVYGIVEEVDEARGQVVIRTQVSRVCGVFGSGRSRDGILHILSKRDDLVSGSDIKAGYSDHILVGGSSFFKETISSAISSGVSGLITGGINAQDYRGIGGGRIIFPKRLDTDIGISVVVCEGFGSVPIGSDIFEFFKEYEGKFVFIDGNRALINLPSFSSSSLVKVKNTRLPKLEDDKLLISEEQNKGISELKVGLKVRVIGNSYLGEQGKVLAINNSLTLLPSGIKTFLATIETARRKIEVPVANLEIIL